MSSQIRLIEAVLSSKRTVFSVQSLMMLTGVGDSQKLTKSLNYYVKTGLIRNPRRGIYTKHEYNPLEMAGCIYRPSYVSCEYILARSGLIFQWDNAITSVSYLSRQVEIDGLEYRYRRINPELWIGMDGIVQEDNIYCATCERAFLDYLYLSAGNCFFDNLHPLDKTKVAALLPLYGSHALSTRVVDLLGINI